MSLPIIYGTDTAGLQQKTYDKSMSMIKNAYSNAIANREALQRMVFSNPDGLTAQQVMDKFGTDAVQLLTISQAAGTFINAVVANSVSLSPPSGVTITPNQDGTVTISQSMAPQSLSMESLSPTPPSDTTVQSQPTGMKTSTKVAIASAGAVALTAYAKLKGYL